MAIMKLKSRPQDFRVTELLCEDIIQPAGPQRVYRIHKRKITSFEAAADLARLVGVTPADVSMAGLKDRQGVTIQHMSVSRGKEVHIRQPDLKIETVGYCEEPLSPAASVGNSFRIIVRELTPRQVTRMRENIPTVREHGYPNYFDEQRFGNLRHRQGWIMLDLIRGDQEDALKRLLASLSPFDSPAARDAKAAIWRSWGNWGACRDHAGRYGKHHSVFEHLRRNDGDWPGAFHRIATRERLIHLYAFQSHLWNLALESWFEQNLNPRERFAVQSRESRLIFPRQAVKFPEAWNGTFPLPGPRLAEVQDSDQLRHLRLALAQHKLSPDDLIVEGVPGFALKHEERPLMILPQNLKARSAAGGGEEQEDHAVELGFELPRGAYATMLVRCLVGPVAGHHEDGPQRLIRGRGPQRVEQAHGRFGSRRAGVGGRDGGTGPGPHETAGRGAWYPDRTDRLDRGSRSGGDGYQGGGHRSGGGDSRTRGSQGFEGAGHGSGGGGQKRGGHRSDGDGYRGRGAQRSGGGGYQGGGGSHRLGNPHQGSDSRGQTKRDGGPGSRPSDMRSFPRNRGRDERERGQQGPDPRKRPKHDGRSDWAEGHDSEADWGREPEAP
ncbi:MAG: hypothetical protein CMJ86_03490 [Planctomycetes bacterium]|nr:hypothetical protein [Planctomycetota bacterium]